MEYLPSIPDPSVSKLVSPNSVISTPLSHRRLEIRSPDYTVYKDKDLDAASNTGSITSELRHRLIRATISNMQAAAYSPPFSRLPTGAELNEMAKSLIMIYPPLKDEETSHILNCVLKFYFHLMLQTHDYICTVCLRQKL